MKNSKHKTQENMRAPGFRERQKQIVLDGELVWVDPELEELLVALNNAGLKTRSHCCGHETGRSFVAIRTRNIEHLEVRMCDTYQELVIQWKAKGE